MLIEQLAVFLENKSGAVRGRGPRGRFPADGRNHDDEPLRPGRAQADRQIPGGLRRGGLPALRTGDGHAPGHARPF